jgi:hypothetical protein
MPYVAVLVIVLGLFVFGYNLVYFCCGRKVNRGIAATNGLAGLFAAAMYFLFVVDSYFFDFLTSEEVRSYCMRPITVVMLSAILANTLRMRWPNDLD